MANGSSKSKPKRYATKPAPKICGACNECAVGGGTRVTSGLTGATYGIGGGIGGGIGYTYGIGGGIGGGLDSE